jgi:Amidohydrolase
VITALSAGKVGAPMATVDDRGGSLAAGEAALERGAWEEARAAFDRALATGGGPEALEGLATAAWFLDDEPLEQSKDVRHLWSALEAIDGERTLLYASDYPHWDFDAPDRLHIPPAWREQVMGANARELYRLARATGSDDRPAEARA